ncbi:maltose acetyltransferase-domain-containing protein [Xylaria acuta]|nr:maltose acetyltransferase-domain-containing protein [Xylaria acuta]
MASTQKDPAAIEASKNLSHVPRGEEYEKMISGMLYDAQAPELVTGRFKARRFMSKYNTHFPDNATPESLLKDREAMLRGIIGKLGSGSFIEPPVNFDYGCNIKIGDNFYSNFNLVILDCGIVEIGNRVMFGPFVSIFAATRKNPRNCFLLVSATFGARDSHFGPR